MVFAEYTPVGSISTSWAYWEYRSLFGQQVETLESVQPKLIMMQVFYHMTLEGHCWEDQWAIGWVEMCSPISPIARYGVEDVLLPHVILS